MRYLLPVLFAILAGCSKPAPEVPDVDAEDVHPAAEVDQLETPLDVTAAVAGPDDSTAAGGG